MLLSINGVNAANADPSHSVLAQAFLSRKGIFETMRVYSGKAFKLRDHMARLRAAALRSAITLPAEIDTIVEHQVERASQGGLVDAFLRVTLTDGEDGNPPTVVTMVTALPSLPAAMYESGIRVTTAAIRRDEFSADAGIKTTSFLAGLPAVRATFPPGTYDALILDTSGHLSEASASNVFLVVDGTLLTPPTSCGALPGITRASVISLARKLDIGVEDSEPVFPERIAAASESFLTSSVREIVPVVAVDDSSIGQGVPGILTRKLMTAYKGLTT